MKAILVKEPTVSIGSNKYPDISLYADSAIGRDVMPLFVPDLDVNLHACVCLAFRINHLGKNIGQKFAWRYVDAVGLVNVIYPDVTTTGGVKFEATHCWTIMDSAITTGQWLDFAPEAMPQIEVNVDGDNRVYDLNKLDVPLAVNSVSRLATLKTGDIIILANTAIEVPLEVNTYIHGTINGAQCLNIKLK